MSTSKYTLDESLGESWVELNPAQLADRITPLPFGSGGEEYLRLLREAQRDSTHSSARHSLASSRRDTPRDSPKSPPNSPNTERSTDDDLKGVYINYSCAKLKLMSRGAFISIDRDWKFKHPLGMTKRKTYSIRTAKVGKNGLFSKEVLYTLFLSNLLSLIIGTGFGVWLTRRGLMMTRVAIE
ncbi:Protein of unknown function [Cotesia congregata]|uniref:Uncharacterized protein n=1 Tax=Cotesia congregata TaxID=51543 RepID=A0A8J2MFT2_COTCN|nr:Protein of unknown function [Cotesia congregata]